MRFLLLIMALIGAVAAYVGPSSAKPPPTLADTIISELLGEKLSIKDNEQSEASTTASSSSSSSTTAASTSTEQASSSTEAMKDPLQEIVSALPITLPPLLSELDMPKRRVITYDQRQEGQYNIRADLDNFMFLLIPAAPADNFNILDILGKSGARRTPHSSLKSNKKKYYPSSSTGNKQDGLKYRQSLKNADYLSKPNDHLGVASRAGDYIEGRTPYHMDISALDEEQVQPRLNPDRQVDVLPPSYPLAYQHLMKPYLEAESSIIQTLPPAEMANRHNSEPSQNSGFFRFARYIRGDNFLDSNRLGPHQYHPASSRRIAQIPMYRSEMSMGAAQLYPPLDVPQFKIASTARSFDETPSTSNEELESKQTLDGGDLIYENVFSPSVHLRPLEDDLDLELHNDGLIEGEAKALLSDGIERCAPGKRRDSYGVCREIQGY
ncbi:uncharacterized protein LOC106091447 [Stomoxys calcitrans]|uniref:uncharacterized protein LOC106091447 n=1 Tax=Stomoxys calcitrans TaxID=35570 RepID=UPI0027E30375|nr:uncharacterized protein LOC106091447 [Stomoxys calcitrans]